MKNGRVIYVAVIGFVFLYIIYAMMRYDDDSASRQAESVRKIIDKALIQCYALEGSYPLNLDQVEGYGVVLDNKRFFFYYEWFGSNMKPQVMVLEK